MPGLIQRLKAATGALMGRSPKAESKVDPEPPGGFSGGSTVGGPLYTDAFRERKAPLPFQLIEKHKSLVYAMVARNRNAVTRLPLRLYADGSRVQGGRPRSACDPVRVTRSTGIRLARDGLVSPAAVDQVYEVRSHPLLDALDRPDPYGYFTRDKFIGLICAYNDVIGSHYIVPEGNGWDYTRPDSGRPKGPPEYLWVLFSQYALPVRKGGSPLIDHFRYFRDQLPFQSVLWFRQNHSLRDPYGAAYSPTYAGDVYADQEDRFVALFDQVLGMGPRPALIATAKDPTQAPSDTDAKRLEQDATRKHSGGRAGSILVNRGAWDFLPVSYPPADLGSKELSEYDLYRLASIFDQPPTYYTVDSNLANLQAADEQHAKQGVEPRCKSIAGTLTHLARTWDPRLFLAFDPAVGENEEAKQKVVDMQLKSGQITINQANQDGRWPPVEWGNEPWLPQTLVQPSMAREKHQQALEQGAAAIESQEKRDEFELSDEPSEKGDDADRQESGQGARAVPMAMMIDRALERLEAELKRKAG